MNCEHETTTFPRPNFRPRQVKCRRKARVVAGVPFGVNTMDFNYCHPCAEKRVNDVLVGRGKVVTLTPIPPNPDEEPTRDALGRFAPKVHD